MRFGSGWPFWSRRQRATHTVEREPLGYEYNDGGINNQKLALLGLFLAASKQDAPLGRRVYLPKIYNKHHDDALSTREAFAEIFWFDMFKAFADRWDIELVEEPPTFSDDRMERNGWHYFGQGAGHLGHLAAHDREAISTDLAADFFRSLVPKVTSSQEFQSICGDIFYRNRIDAVVQLRIEQDWLHYSRYHLSVVVGNDEDYCLTAPEIIKKVVDTLPEIGKTFYVSCDERYVPQPKSEIKEAVLARTGAEIVFKTDVISAEAFDRMRQVDASLVDFEIGKIANVFVGLSRSTFANMVCFERYACLYRASQNDYIYNKTGALLGRRTDLGTQPDPQAATA